eukprot:CAMPEP_0183800646 /NCGR_PEP_ID=MMETSP0803_2-20130417/25555_1 /TAXON_ID=195967 /ORGANISM="Crustomastix stigmata, Strain CCMP3273" /LENGTH=576 /DNA_ID=CAMNT_0026045365 /DNA_START=319 /DNA_END=2046 /DNA_ORIENTATION=-
MAAVLTSEQWEAAVHGINDAGSLGDGPLKPITQLPESSQRALPSTSGDVVVPELRRGVRLQQETNGVYHCVLPFSTATGYAIVVGASEPCQLRYLRWRDVSIALLGPSGQGLEAGLRMFPGASEIMTQVKGGVPKPVPRDLAPHKDILFVNPAVCLVLNGVHPLELLAVQIAPDDTAATLFPKELEVRVGGAGACGSQHRVASFTAMGAARPLPQVRKMLTSKTSKLRQRELLQANGELAQAERLIRGVQERSLEEAEAMAGELLKCEAARAEAEQAKRAKKASKKKRAKQAKAQVEQERVAELRVEVPADEEDDTAVVEGAEEREGREAEASKAAEYWQDGSSLSDDGEGSTTSSGLASPASALEPPCSEDSSTQDDEGSAVEETDAEGPEQQAIPPLAVPAAPSAEACTQTSPAAQATPPPPPPQEAPPRLNAKAVPFVPLVARMGQVAAAAAAAAPPRHPSAFLSRGFVVHTAPPPAIPMPQVPPPLAHAVPLPLAAAPAPVVPPPARAQRTPPAAAAPVHWEPPLEGRAPECEAAACGAAPWGGDVSALGVDVTVVGEEAAGGAVAAEGVRG